MIGRNLRRLILAAGALALAAAIGALAARAALTASPITACVPGGAAGPRALLYSADGSCGAGQTALTWNTEGPVGPAGPAGPPGPQGPAGPPGQTPLAPTVTQTVVRAVSKVDTKPTHTAVAYCPEGASVLYGGAGVIAPGTDPTGGRIRVTGSSPRSGPTGAPVGWEARATQHLPDRVARALVELAKAERLAYSSTFSVALNTDGGPEYQSMTSGWFEEAMAQYAEAIARANKANKVIPTVGWGVSAWVVCGVTAR